VYSRAQLSRIVAPVVVLYSTAVAAGAGAWQFRAANTVDHNNHAGHNALVESTVSAEVPMTSLMAWARLSVDDHKVLRCTDEFDRTAFEAAMAGVCPEGAARSVVRGTDRTNSQGGVN
jgi:hypothetical protein